MLVSGRAHSFAVCSLSQRINTVMEVVAASHANHPPGLGSLHMLGEARVCDFHFPVELRPHPRLHGWQNLELSQLRTEGSALVPGPSLTPHKGQMPLVIKWYLHHGEEKRPLSLRGYNALPLCPPGAESVLPRGAQHPARIRHTCWEVWRPGASPTFGRYQLHPHLKQGFR